ncbi:hypothetical protein AVEN_254308-1 [Araneus ventricosus]|uniref:Uncharacterized protein n=1 Tax=Araneus ventricosus TaxID=182803 RepID=A0A4Y2VHU8_ARAVE|nr:hypothetical protein AVEN_254308-1 [Araneus ventricosus]
MYRRHDRHPVRSPVLIHVHCAFRRIGTIPAGQCDIPRVQSCYQVAPINTLLTLDTSIGHLNPQRALQSYNGALLEYSMPICIRDALLHAVEKRSPPPRTPMDLLTALQDSWCEFPPGYLQTPVEFMPRRFASLLRARGGPTRY